MLGQALGGKATIAHPMETGFRADSLRETTTALGVQAQSAREAQEAALPKVKRDTLIRFWPVQSVLHGAAVQGTSNGGGN